jgi:streptomycin 6-kinase
MISIPSLYARRIENMLGEKGQIWIASLEERIAISVQRWNCQILEPFELSYNYVAPVVLKDGSDAVLKLFIPNNDFQNEVKVLAYYKGLACNVHDSIPELEILLLERLVPGQNLKSVSEDNAISAVVEIIRKLKEASIKTVQGIPTITDLATGIGKCRNHFSGQSGPFQERVLQQVEELFPRLISTQKSIYLLHGDLHHENILSSGSKWKLIDPEGILGEVEFEVARFLINNLPDRNMEQVIEHRISGLEKGLDASTERMYGWGLCLSVLAAWWDIEDHIGITDKDLAIVDFFSRKV